ncbi:MAG: acyl carrier protein [Lachnospiraceae bacterium]|nr:acyl carrier protein [Lachnospiraceae bacterium]
MEAKVLEILAEINDEILDYDGDSLVESGLLDSFQIVDLVGMLEEEFDIEIDAELVVVENFETKEAIIKMLEGIL